MLRKVIIVFLVLSAAPFFVPWLPERLGSLPFGPSLVYTLRLSPAVLAVLLLWEVSVVLMRINVVLPFVAALGLLGLFGAYPTVANRVIDGRAAELATGDQRRFTRPTSIKVLGIISQQSTLRCDGLCQRLLLGGQVPRLVYATARDPLLAPVVGISAVSFRMERRATCPQPDLEVEDPTADVTPSGKASSPLANMRAAISGGNCLITERAALGDADVVLFDRSIGNAEPSFIASLLLVDEKVAQGQRLSMFQRDGNMFRESYRRTVVSADKIAQVIYWPFGFGGSSIMQRFSQIYFDGPSWNMFLTDMLGFDLSMKAKT